MRLAHTFIAVACLLGAVPNSLQQAEKAVTGAVKSRAEDAIKKFFFSELPKIKIPKITLGPFFFYVTSLQFIGSPDVEFGIGPGFITLSITNIALKMEGTFIMFFPLLEGTFEANSSGGTLSIVHNTQTDKVVFCSFDLGQYTLSLTFSKKNGKSSDVTKRKQNQLMNQIKKELEKASVSAGRSVIPEHTGK